MIQSSHMLFVDLKIFFFSFHSSLECIQIRKSNSEFARWVLEKSSCLDVRSHLSLVSIVHHLTVVICLIRSMSNLFLFVSLSCGSVCTNHRGCLLTNSELPFVPAFPQQDGQRPVGPGPLPHAGLEPHQGPPRPAAPAYGLITDLPLPVPTADSQVPNWHSVQNQSNGLLRLQFLYFYTAIEHLRM